MARNFLSGRARPWRALAPAALVLLAVALPSAGHAVGDVRDTHGDSLSDFDLRAGRLSPTAAQRAGVRRLRASATWNAFGTPSTLIRYRGSLGRVQGRTAAVAARRWLAANAGLFRLGSVSELRLGPTAPLGRRGRAVIFRQVAGRRPLLNDGLATVALRQAAPGAWNVIFVSSSLTPNLRVAGRATIGADQAWMRAARNVGHKVSDLLGQDG